MSHYIAYYDDQIGGGGILGKAVFSGTRYQRGHGIGSFLGGLLRMALPYLKSGAMAVGEEALKAGANIGRDVLHSGTSLKEAVKQRSAESRKNLKRRAAQKLIDVMKGSGYKASRAKKKRQCGRSSRANNAKGTTKQRKKHPGIKRDRKRKKKARATASRRKTRSQAPKRRKITDIFGPV